MNRRILCLLILLILAMCLPRALAEVPQIIDPDPDIKTTPNDPIGYFERANAWLMKQQYDKAIADYGMALELNHEFADALFNRGYTYRMKELFDLALADYSQVLRLEPKNADALNNRGVVWCCKGNFLQAEVDFDAALQLDPKSYVAKENRKRLLEGKDNFQKLIDRGDIPELEDAYIRFADELPAKK